MRFRLPGGFENRTEQQDARSFQEFVTGLGKATVNSSSNYASIEGVAGLSK